MSRKSSDYVFINLSNIFKIQTNLRFFAVYATPLLKLLWLGWVS